MPLQVLDATGGTKNILTLSGDGSAGNPFVMEYAVKLTDGTTTITMGQQAKASSVPVTLASDQPDIGINLDKVGNSAVTLGQGLMAASIPVAIASNQSDVPINIDKVGNSAVTLGQNIKASSFPVTIASDQSNVPTYIADISVAISLTSSGTNVATGALNGANTVAVYLSSLGTGGTIQFEGTVDNSNWFSVQGIPFTGGTPVSSTSAAGQWQFNVAGLQNFRCRASALTSGTISGTMRVSAVEAITTLGPSSSAIGSVTQGGSNWSMNLAQVGASNIALGQAAKASSFPVTMASDQPNINVVGVPATSGGCSIYRNINLGTTGVNIKGSGGQLYAFYFANAASSVRFVKFYNKATAPTVGTDTPVLTFQLPANSGGVLPIPPGAAFSSGIGIGGTNLVADSDTTAPSTNDIVVNVFYA